MQKKQNKKKKKQNKKDKKKRQVIMSRQDKDFLKKFDTGSKQEIEMVEHGIFESRGVRTPRSNVWA
jgi:hypothetical protein